MALKEKLQDDLKSALKEKKEIEALTLRMLNAAILNKGECLAQGELLGMLNGKSLEDFFYERVKQ